jgi:hypothetical protein
VELTEREREEPAMAAALPLYIGGRFVEGRDARLRMS